jgi:hypothetical protein
VGADAAAVVAVVMMPVMMVAAVVTAVMVAAATRVGAGQWCGDADRCSEQGAGHDQAAQPAEILN